MNTRNVNVADLPEHAFGHHSMSWWGTIGFVAVEGTFFGVLIATYLYGVGRAPEWPPGPVEPPPLLWGSLNAALMLVSCWPNHHYSAAAHRMDVRASRRWLLVAVAIGAAFLAVRAMEFATLNVRWDEHFYGSIVWAILVFHTVHIFADFVECVVLALIAHTKPVTPHRFTDFADDATYWYFVVAAWLPLYALVYLLPRFL